MVSWVWCRMWRCGQFLGLLDGQCYIAVPQTAWLQLCFRMKFKMLVIIAFKALHSMGSDYLRNRLTIMELVCVTHASRRGMVQTPTIKEFQLVGSRRTIFSPMPTHPQNEIHTHPSDFCKGLKTWFCLGPLCGCIMLEVTNRLRQDPQPPPNLLCVSCSFPLHLFNCKLLLLLRPFIVSMVYWPLMFIGLLRGGLLAFKRWVANESSK